TEHFEPIRVDKIKYSCTLWGRLDFGPNIAAIDWFAKNVWENMRRQNEAATFDVFGFNATEYIQSLAKRYKFNVMADLPDLRSEVQKRQVVVMPFISGGGIKNKFLEAAAMGMPIIANSRATNGIDRPMEAPWISAETDRQWVDALSSLWNSPSDMRKRGKMARRWVESTCTWQKAAQIAVEGIRQ
ncbi:glycosyltransferase, partial [bacterium]|nr:glycosyltransferase [bacterium]